jgi:hypothetical protein
MYLLDENETHALTLEYQASGDSRGWWLELIEKATGQTQITIWNSKDVLKGVTIPFAQKHFCSGVKFHSLYKPGYQVSDLHKKFI